MKVYSSRSKNGYSKIITQIANELKNPNLYNIEEQTIIWQYNSFGDTLPANFNRFNQKKWVLWINNFSDFIRDNNFEYYLKMTDFVVVPTPRAKKYLLSKGISEIKVWVLEFQDFLSSWDINPNAIQNNKVHRLENSKIPSQIMINNLANDGGYGLVEADSYNISSTFPLFIEAGIPVIVLANTGLADIVSKYRLGMVIDDIEKIDKYIERITPNQYSEYHNNELIIGQKLKNGWFTTRALLESEYNSRITSSIFSSYASILRPANYNMKVMNTNDTLDFIEKYHPSITRLGDGEISLINGASQINQVESADLVKRLDQVVKTCSSQKLLVCLPDVFHSLDRFGQGVQNWWNGHMQTYNHYYTELGKQNNIYGNAMITRPYLYLNDKSHAGEVFSRIKQWWQDKDILLVEGYYTRSGVGNDLYDNAHSVQRIICPPKNAWEKSQQIEQAIKKFGKNKVVLVMLGTAATVIAADLSDWGQVIDLGHLDSEYEWYKMGATERVPLKGKHTAEMNYDEGIEDIHDPKYESEIILDLTKKENEE